MIDDTYETLENLGDAIESERPLSMMERRRFLQAAAFAGAGAVAIPTFLAGTAGAQTSSTDTILLTVTLDGGNDGLNTLGPFGSGQYRDLRVSLAIG